MEHTMPIILRTQIIRSRGQKVANHGSEERGIKMTDLSRLLILVHFTFANYK